MWSKGDRIRHARWGAGIVEAKLVLGRVRVVFDREPGLPRTIHKGELLLDSGAPLVGDEPASPASAPPPAPAPRSMQAGAPAAPEAPPRVRSPGSLAVARDPAPTPVIEPAEPPPPAAVRPTGSPAPQALDPADAWQTIEALRLGVVPARGVRSYTVARDAELANLDALFGEGAGCRVVWGDYGAGKTHLLDAAEQLGLERGYAVARMTLDPREQALHKPLRLYRSIMSSVRTGDQVRPGFEYILDSLKDSPDHCRPDGSSFSRFFSPYMHVLRTSNETSEGWLRDWVRGDPIGSDEVNRILDACDWRGLRALRLSDYRTYGRMYIHLIGTLACWVRDAGARGLLLLFDEVERVDALRYEDQNYALEVLQHYAAVTMRPADLAFDPEELYKGGVGVHRALPLRFQEHQPLISVFALTPLEEIEEHFAGLTASESYDIHLPPLDPTILPSLVERVAELYARAYLDYRLHAEVHADIVRRIRPVLDDGHDSFRDAVRSTVFLLDEDRFQQRAGGAR